MQSLPARCLILVGVLAVGLVLLAFDREASTAAARLPAARTELLAADGWTLTNVSTEDQHGVSFMHWTLVGNDGAIANLTLATSPAAKHIFKSGPDVPFRGNGYDVQAPPNGLLPPGTDRDAMMVQRGNDVALVLYAYGERRGLLGRGLHGWAAALFDALRGARNDYYMASIVVSLHGVNDPQDAERATRLAETVFPRLARWYAGDSPSTDANVSSSPLAP